MESENEKKKKKSPIIGYVGNQKGVSSEKWYGFNIWFHFKSR